MKKPVSAQTVRHPKAQISFRRNFLPPLLGLLIASSVFGLLNVQWLIAQVQYHLIAQQKVVAIANVIPASDAHELIIPRIGVRAPINEVPDYDQKAVQSALQSGVVHYGPGAAPGQVGNTVIVGHSSGVLWEPGDYKFVFTLLDKLAPDDRIIIEYHGVRYTYEVTDSLVVSPNDLAVLKPTDKPQLTLITCTPVGTSKNRLVVHARQVTPDPSLATPGANNKPLTGVSLPQ